MPSGPQPRNPCCCTCNKNGLCLRCVCVKNGKHYVSFLPSRYGTCSNYMYESSLPQSFVPTASSRSSFEVQHVLCSVLSSSLLATSSPHHNPPRSPGCTNFLDRVVSSLPSSPQGDLVNGATLPSLRTSTIPYLDSIFLPKLLTLQHVPKGP